MHILVTGSTGFVGKQLVPYLLKNTEATLCLAQRSAHHEFINSRIDYFKFSELNENVQWQSALTNCNIVIHLAARAHVMQEKAKSPLDLYRVINTKATLNLARQAAKAKVKRFIYISSIKVNGEETNGQNKFLPDDRVKPTDPYALSKFEAEEGLMEIAKSTDLEVVIIRPPLIYGPLVKGNFLKMLTLVQKGIPLPLAKTHNKRSLVSVYNLVDLITVCLEHKNAANQIFLVSDGEDLSTTAIINKMAYASGRSARYFAMPIWLMAFLLRIIGKYDLFQRLFGSLQVDISKTCTLLDWQPKITNMF